MSEKEIPDRLCGVCGCEEWILNPDKDDTAYCLNCNRRVVKGAKTGIWRHKPSLESFSFFWIAVALEIFLGIGLSFIEMVLRGKTPGLAESLGILPF